jgi:hypothetical protein
MFGFQKKKVTIESAAGGFRLVDKDHKQVQYAKTTSELLTYADNNKMVITNRSIANSITPYPLRMSYRR